MKKALEMARDLVRYLEERAENTQVTEDENKGLVKLSELAAGEVFATAIGEFIVLEHLEEGTKVITKELYKKDIEFDDKSTDYKKSELKKLCDGKIYDDFARVFGAGNMVEHVVDLTTVDMQQDFGTTECTVRPLTFDEARKYNALLVDKELPDWWWTVTPWSTAERGWKYSISVVSPSGSVIDCGYVNYGGVRPFCILKSNIFVSKEK